MHHNSRTKGTTVMSAHSGVCDDFFVQMTAGGDACKLCLVHCRIARSIPKILKSWRHTLWAGTGPLWGRKEEVQQQGVAPQC